MEIILIFVGAALVNNYIFTQFLGLCPFFGVSKKIESAVGMGLAVWAVLMVSSSLTYAFYNLVLVPLGIEYLQTISFILIIASIVQFVEVFMKKMLKSLYSVLGLYLPLITVNCTIFGVSLINVRNDFSFLEMFFNSLGAGGGFTLAIILLSSIREKFESSQGVPEIVKGMPIALFSAGLMSIAFMGFQGLI